LNLTDRADWKSMFSGRFTPISLLGRGGMGEVWLCHDRLTDSTVAVKQVAPEVAEGPVGQRHQREFTFLRQLRHPSILVVDEYGIDSTSGARWFSSEVLEGPVSTELAGTMLLPEFLEMCGGVLRALAFLHRNGWVHGDIKSDNVQLRKPPVFGGPPDAVLLDFGLCQRQGQPPEERILGTPHAMPPEQWLGEKPDARGDVYSTGILFYQWWCGRLPFRGGVRTQLGRKHLQEEAPGIDSQRAGLPLPLQKLIGKMLSKRPDDRPTDAGEVLALLQGAFLDEGVEACSETDDSLAAQIRQPGMGDEIPRHILDTILLDKESGGCLLHLHRILGDRRAISETVATHLMTRGIQVIRVAGDCPDPLEQVEQRLQKTSGTAVIRVEDPDTSTEVWSAAIQRLELSGCRLIWWLQASKQPGGYLGQSLSDGRFRLLETDRADPQDLTRWLSRALPGALLDRRLQRRLERWGANSPDLWERILIGRVRSGELGHDGRRWTWTPMSKHPEDRWRDRVGDQLEHLHGADRAIVEALAVLHEPSTFSDVAEVSRIDAGLLPSRVAALVQAQWLRIEEGLCWNQSFQGEGVLLRIPAERRQLYHQRAADLEHLHAQERTRHALSAGDIDAAVSMLDGWLSSVDLHRQDPAILSELLTPLVERLQGAQKVRWAELLGRVEDHHRQPARRDRAWRIAARWQQPGSVDSLRVARCRAAATRRDGTVSEALAIIDECDGEVKEVGEEYRHERARLAIERSRILRTLARRGSGSAPILEDIDVGGCPQLMCEILLERSRCALARGARLQGLELAQQVQFIDSGSARSRLVAESRCLQARAREDLRSLRVWSGLHRHLCLIDHRVEAAAVAGIEAAEASFRLGETSGMLEQIVPLVEEVRSHCLGQLPRALLLQARCEAGSGWIRSASRCLEEALSLDGPAGIISWEGNLLVAASEWAAGRPQTAMQILDATPPHRAPHEKETVDVHSRHVLLQSRCAFSLGDPDQALNILDRGLTVLRLRGTDRDLGILRRERADLLERLGHSAKAQMERRRIAAGVVAEPGTDPEPAGLRRSRKALDMRRSHLLRGQRELADRQLEVAALDALRLRAQPISTWLTLQRAEEASSEEMERLARSAWKRVVRLETREGRAFVLLWWARAREAARDLSAGQKLRRAAIAEIDGWLSRSPEGTRWKELAGLLGVSGLLSDTISGIGGRNASLA